MENYNAIPPKAHSLLTKKTNTVSVKSSDTSVENSHKNIFEPKDIKNLLSSYKRDLSLSNFTMKRAIKNVGKWIMNAENNRYLQMRSDFDEEKEYKLEKQKELQNHIEELSNYYKGENKITYFNNKIKQQKELFKNYTEIKDKIDEKLNLLKKMLPDLEKKIFSYKIQLRKLNKENLKLMGQVNKFENELSNKLEEDLDNFNYSLDNNNLNENNTIKNNNASQFSNGENSSFLNNSINIPEILDKNENLKKKNDKVTELKEYYKEIKKENDNLIKNINLLYNNFFRCKKIYREGMHEIAKELLRINEIELYKVINNTNTNFNSLYFDIFKTNYNNGQLNNDYLRNSIINSNINKKYQYPVSEKAQPNDLLYKVVKNIIDENNTINKINNIKKNKFSWNEFKDFSAYQIYTLLNINKDTLNKLDNYLFNSN